MWEPTTANPMGEPLTGHTSEVVAVCAVPGPGGRTLLATGGRDATVRLWDPATGTSIGVLQVGIEVDALCASPDGSLAIGTSEGVAVLVVRLAAEG
jgi:WD40 repeat protein